MTDASAGEYMGPVRLGWRFWGLELKRHREAASLSQRELGEKVFVSAGYMSQFELATRKPQLDVARRMDEVLGTDGFLARMWEELINQSPHAAYFADVAHLEPLAESICDYHPSLVPGLLQTEAYARAMFRAGRRLLSKDGLKQAVDARTERTKILRDTGGNANPRYWAILDEAALRRPIGTDAEMAEQLEHLAELIRSGRILVQVMPFTERGHALVEGSLKLMTFEDAPPVAYTEGPWSGQLLDDPALTAACRMSYDLARGVALSFDVSLSLIESLAEEYRDDPEALP